MIINIYDCKDKTPTFFCICHVGLCHAWDKHRWGPGTFPEVAPCFHHTCNHVDPIFDSVIFFQEKVTLYHFSKVSLRKRWQTFAQVDRYWGSQVWHRFPLLQKLQNIHCPHNRSLCVILWLNQLTNALHELMQWWYSPQNKLNNLIICFVKFSLLKKLHICYTFLLFCHLII